MNILAEIEQSGNGALGIHEAARAEGVADALIDAILKRNIDVELKRGQTALADGADDVIGPLQSPRALGGGLDGGGQAVVGDIAMAELCDHVEIGLREIGKGEGCVGQLGTVRISRISPRVKPMEPAPIKAIFSGIERVILSL